MIDKLNMKSLVIIFFFSVVDKMKEKDRVGVGLGIRFWPSCAMPTSFMAVTYMEMYYRKTGSTSSIYGH